MIKYSRYLVKNLIVKKTIYLLMAFFSILIFSLVAVQSHRANKTDTSYITSIDTFAKFFPFLLSTCFTIMIVIFNFKSTEKDGSDLLIISKPIRRISIFYSKIFIALATIACFHIFAFIIYMISAATDKVATPQMMLNFALSLALGGFVVQLIVVSILIIIASFFNSISVISVGILFSAIIPIASLIITQVSKAKPAYFSPNERNVIDLSKVQNFKMEGAITNEQKKSTLDSNNVYNMRAINADGSSPELAGYYEWQKNNWYPKVAKFDIWYQWGSFMEAFTSSRPTSSKSVRNWIPSAGYLSIPDEKLWKVKFKINGNYIEHKIALLLKPFHLNINNNMLLQDATNKNILQSYVDAYNSLLAKGFIRVKGHPTNSNPDPNTLTEDENKALVMFDYFLRNEDLYGKLDCLVLRENVPALTKTRALMFLINKVEDSEKVDSTGKTPVKLAMYTKNNHGVNHWQEYVHPNKLRASTYMVMADKMAGFYLSKPYIETSTITVVWVSIMLSLFLFGGLSFFKKDIK